MNWMNPAYYVLWTQNDVELSSFKYSMYYGKLMFFRLAATDRGVYVAYQRETAKELEFTLKIAGKLLTMLFDWSLLIRTSSKNESENETSDTGYFCGPSLVTGVLKVTGVARIFLKT